METALEIAREAAEIIVRVYQEPFDVAYKGPRDPVTLADKESNALICERLAAAFPGLPIVAEESEASAYAGYESAPVVWFVDPLDGTREFVARNGEFVVMIGLAEAGRATAGVVLAPADGRAWIGGDGVGAFAVSKDGARKPLRARAVANARDARVVMSRSHKSRALEEFIGRLGARETVELGSTGLKAMAVASGEADIYVQPGRAGSRWDACAPEAIARAAGCIVGDDRGALIDYASGGIDNDHGLLVTTPALLDAVLAALHPSR